MIATPLKSTTDCRVDLSDLPSTVARYEKLLSAGPCPHPHISKGMPPPRTKISVYVVMDSNCRSGWPKCDKARGDWLWIIACDNRNKGHTIPVTYKIKSLEPVLLKLLLRPKDSSSVSDEFNLDIPLRVFPFYAKRKRSYCEYSHVRIVRYPIQEFRRAILEINIKIGVDGNLEERIHEQKATIGVAIVPVLDTVSTGKKETKQSNNKPLTSEDDEKRSSQEINLIASRLQDLADNVKQDLDLLKEYENALRYEVEPRSRAKYRRNIEELHESVTIYMQEYNKLRKEVAGEPPQKMQHIADKLREMTAKLDSLLAGQIDIKGNLTELKRAVLSRFEVSEKTIIAAIVDQLNKSQLIAVQAVLDGLEARDITEIQLQEEILVAVRQTLTEIQEKVGVLPDTIRREEIERLLKVVDDPTLDVKHKLKFTVPIVPLVLAYEGEVELNSKLNLQRAWEWLIDKLRGGP